MIAIQTNKDMIFNSSKGRIRMEIDVIQNKPNQGLYEMRIVDSVNKDVEEEQEVPVTSEDGTITYETQKVIVNKILDVKPPRFKTMTYEELDNLVQFLDVDMSQGNLRENINNLFRKGLLIVTQQECVNGISGEPGRGMYFTEAQDWEIFGERSTLDKLN